MRRARILVADDYEPIRVTLKKMLEPAYEVVGCVGDGRTLVTTAMDLQPDLVLLDVGLPVLNGLAAGRELRKLAPQVKLLFLTMNPDPDVEGEAIRMGASGYILKYSIPEDLLPAVKHAVGADGEATA